MQDLVPVLPSCPDHDPDGNARAKDQDSERCQPQSIGVRLEGRLHQDEVAITRNEKILDRLVAVTSLDARADEPSQIDGQRSVRLVERLALTDQATQFLLQISGARLLNRIGKRVRCRQGLRRRGSNENHHSQEEMSHSAASATTVGEARGTRRRLHSAANPPSAMTSAPSQISGASGLT